MFREIPRGLDSLPSYMSIVTKNKGFYFFPALIKAVIGDVEVYFIIWR